MCIDEKMIGGRYTTILSNQKTGHIALLLDSYKPAFAKDAILLFEQETLKKIKYINMDMSPTIKSICTHSIPWAKHIVDKFHLIKHLIDIIKGERLRLKNEQKKISKKKKKPDILNINGWTNLELLEKSRYALTKRMNKLYEKEVEIVEAVLMRYPTLKTIYDISQEFRKWYDSSNIGKKTGFMIYQLNKWIDKAELLNIKAFQNFIDLVQNHIWEIVRYFINGQTNAKAENLNGKIQRFFANNYGTRNRDFLFYRIQIYFAPAPQKKI